jgi:hypothetical protein
MTEDDIIYLQRRAEAELELAQQATKPEVVAAHHQLAEAYLDRIASGAPARQAEHA